MQVVFNGDYNVVAAESLVPRDPLQPSVDGQIEWVVNGMPGSPPLGPVFHRFWTDSRNMSCPTEDYSQPRAYTPPDLNTGHRSRPGRSSPSADQPLRSDPDASGVRPRRRPGPRTWRSTPPAPPTGSTRSLPGTTRRSSARTTRPGSWSRSRGLPDRRAEHAPRHGRRPEAPETEFVLTIVGPDRSPAPRWPVPAVSRSWRPSSSSAFSRTERHSRRSPVRGSASSFVRALPSPGRSTSPPLGPRAAVRVDVAERGHGGGESRLPEPRPLGAPEPEEARNRRRQPRPGSTSPGTRSTS